MTAARKIPVNNVVHADGTVTGPAVDRIAAGVAVERARLASGVPISVAQVATMMHHCAVACFERHGAMTKTVDQLRVSGWFGSVTVRYLGEEDGSDPRIELGMLSDEISIDEAEHLPADHARAMACMRELHTIANTFAGRSPDDAYLQRFGDVQRRGENVDVLVDTPSTCGHIVRVSIVDGRVTDVGLCVRGEHATWHSCTPDGAMSLLECLTKARELISQGVEAEWGLSPAEHEKKAHAAYGWGKEAGRNEAAKAIAALNAAAKAEHRP